MWTEEFLEYLRQSTTESPKFEEAITFKQQHLPKQIYKYRGDDPRAHDTLKSSTIWLASPDSYNDPYDCFLRFSASTMTSAFERGLIDSFVTGLQLEVPADKVDEIKQSATPLETLSHNITGVRKPGANPKEMVQFLSQIGRKFVEDTVNFLQLLQKVIKICSFSAVSDSIIMWSHYGSNHQGFCVEYDLERFDLGDAFLRNLYPVVYSNQLFDLTPWAEKMVSGEAATLTSVFPLLGVIQKFHGWAYEKEWRYVSFQENPTPNRTRPMPLPSRVFLGAKAVYSTKKELLAICTDKNIPVWQMRMSDEKYELLADPISDAKR